MIKHYIEAASDTNISMVNLLGELDIHGYYLQNIGRKTEQELLEIVTTLGGKLHNPINPTITVKYNQSTQLKAMSQSTLELHNECAYMAKPPGYVLLYCVKGADKGGDFYILNSSHILKEVPQSIINILENNPFIFSGQGSSIQRKLIIEHSRKSNNKVIFMSNIGKEEGRKDKIMTPLAEEDSAYLALESLQGTLEKNEGLLQFHQWKTGDMVIIDNYQVLHGRESFVGEYRELKHIRFNI